VLGPERLLIVRHDWLPCTTRPRAGLPESSRLPIPGLGALATPRRAERQILVRRPQRGSFVHSWRKPSEVPLPWSTERVQLGLRLSTIRGGWRRRVPGAGPGGHGRRNADRASTDGLADGLGGAIHARLRGLARRRRDTLGPERQRSLSAPAGRLEPVPRQGAYWGTITGVIAGEGAESW